MTAGDIILNLALLPLRLVQLLASLVDGWRASIQPALDITNASQLTDRVLSNLLRELCWGEARLNRAICRAACNEAGVVAPHRPLASYRGPKPRSATVLLQRIERYRHRLIHTAAAISRLARRIRHALATPQLDSLRDALAPARNAPIPVADASASALELSG